MALPLLLRQTGWSSRGVSYSQLNGQLGGPVGVDVYACRLPAGLEITEVGCVGARQVSEILAAVLKTVCGICQ